MVQIPTAQPSGQPVGSVQTQAADTPFSNVRPADTSQVGRDISALGGVLGDVAQTLAARNQRIALREAEVSYMSLEREILDPRTGVFARRQGNAVGATQEVAARMADFRRRILDEYGGRLAGSGRDALDQYLRGAEQRMWKRTAAHELNEATRHEESLLTAQMEGQIDRAAFLYNFGEEVSAAELQIETLAGDLADMRGLTGVARDQFIEAHRSGLYTQVASQMAQESPTKALNYVEELMRQGRIDPTDAVAMIAQLKPEAIEEQGRGLAAAAHGGTAYRPPSSPLPDRIEGSPVPQFLDRLIYRESSGNPSLIDGADDGRDHVGLGQFGEARFQDLKNAGVVPQDMSLYEFGTAENADLQMEALRWHIADIDREIDSSDYLAKGWTRDGLRAVAHLGGITGMHEFVTSGGEYNPSDVLGTHLSEYYAQFGGITLEGTLAGITAIEDHPDPQVRAAAADELERIRSREHTQYNRTQAQLKDYLYSEIDAALANGEEYDLEAALSEAGVREMLGADVKSVRDYWRSGANPKTNWDVYRDLQIASETNPDEFAVTDLNDFRSQLEPSLFRSFVDKQAAILGDSQKEGSAQRVTITDLRSNIAPLLTGRSPEERGFLERRMTEYIQTYTELNNGQPPDALQQYAHAERLSSDFTGQQSFIADYDDPLGSPNDLVGILREADENGLQTLFEDTDLTLNIPRGAGQFEEMVITPAEMRNMAARYEIATDRTPKPSQVIQMIYLIKSGLMP